MKYIWDVSTQISKKETETLSSYPRIIRQLLVNRDIKTKRDAELFFSRKEEAGRSLSKLYDLNKASNVINDYIKRGKKIVIHGDFDVDGICATSIVWDFLFRKLKADVLPYIPSRFDEGYGMTDKSLENVQKQGADLVITVDCGIKDDDLIQKWEKRGINFVITDHHEFKEGNSRGENVILPDKALAIVHPKYPKKELAFADISGTTVAWKLVEELGRVAEVDYDFSDYLDLVALATVCDIMPLVDENRRLVKRGIEKMKEGKRIGLLRLLNDSGIDLGKLSTYHMGFIIGPRLNAAGRLDHALDAVRLLVTNSRSTAGKLSEKLRKLNQKRQSIQEDIHMNALKQIENVGFDRKLYFVWGEDWAEGVVGIVAGKISETYNRPVLVASGNNGMYKGSARSIETFNIIEAINSQQDLLERFGGHPQAAGFTIKAENIEQFRDNLLEIADQELSDDDIKRTIKADSYVELKDLDRNLLDWIQKLEPFGFGNSKPKFVAEDVEINDVRVIGSSGKHLKFSFYVSENGKYLDGIAFNMAERYKNLQAGNLVDLLFTFEINEWNGIERLQLNMKDIKVR